MKKADRVRLQHMLEAAHEAVEFLAEEPRTSLDLDRKLLLALVKDIEIIGEAASRVTEDCQTRFPHIPWSQIRSMRNRLIHAYFDINVETVWKTVKEDLPPLIDALERVMAAFPPDADDSE